MSDQNHTGGTNSRRLRLKRVPHPRMRQACIVPVSHKPDSKGYVRIFPRKGPQGARALPLHRLAYLSKHGPASIPEGWEIDHICGRRSCANRSHLRPLNRSDHKRVTALMRGVEKKEAGWCYYRYYRPHWSELVSVFDIKPKTAQAWIQAWNKELKAEVSAQPA